LDVKDWIIAISIIIGFFAVALMHVFSYQQGHNDGRRCSENYYRVMLGDRVWLWVNGRFYPYDITEDELRAVVVTDRIHGGSLEWPRQSKGMR
jgi:hypothetical protein